MPVVPSHTTTRPGYAGIIVNFFAFEIVWVVTVLGAANDLTWPGVVALLVFICLHAWLTAQWINDSFLVAVAVSIGFLFDSALVRSGLLAVQTEWPIAGLAPLWMVILWANLALIINHCLGWLHGRYWLAAVFGALGGPLAYLGGAALGAGDFTTDGPGLWIGLGLGWAGITPLLFWLGTQFSLRREQARQSKSV